MRKLLAVTLILSAALFPACKMGKNQTSQTVKTNSQSAHEPGVKAFDFNFVGVSGKPIKLSDYKGKVVIIQFFGTYCPPCRAEMPFLNKLYQDYKGKVVVIGLAVNAIGEPSSKLKPFVKEMGISYPVASPDEKAWDNYAGTITKMDSIPQTFIVDKEGYIRYYNVGYTPQYDALYEKAVQKLLNEK